MRQLANGLTAPAILMMVVSVAGCGTSDDDRVIVFAASSLTDVMAEIEEQYELTRPGVDLVVNHGGSSTLAAQIEQGAPADVFASADIANAERVADGRAVAVFTRNELVIAVEPGNPRGVVGLVDLARGDLVVVLAAPQVPAGAYAATVLADAGVVAAADSLEQNVRSVASKITLGEADVGIVYRTDVVAADGALDAVAIPGDVNVVADYAVVTLTDRDAAADVADFLLSDDAQAIFAEQGFSRP